MRREGRGGAKTPRAFSLGSATRPRAHAPDFNSSWLVPTNLPFSSFSTLEVW